ncbi:Folate-dependent protein for Fe/S cluster synthesis/repair in oxidative stress [Klebsiella pneumoniae IS39]|nr:Folate-dependent protein for Fe/S cluster synthesis/repair in oxidative stress [Klebsiella pneumoniae IS39]
MVSEGATSLLWFEHPGERFLLVTDVDTANRVTTRCAAKRSLTTANSGWR